MHDCAAADHGVGAAIWCAGIPARARTAAVAHHTCTLRIHHEMLVAFYWPCRNVATCANMPDNASLCTQLSSVTCAAATYFFHGPIHCTLAVITHNGKHRAVHMPVRTTVTTPGEPGDSSVRQASYTAVDARACTHIARSCNLQHVNHTPPMSHMPSRTFAPVLCRAASASPHVFTFLQTLRLRSFTLQQQYNAAVTHMLLALLSASSAAANRHDRSSLRQGGSSLRCSSQGLLRMKQLSRYSLHRLCAACLVP